MDDYTNIEDSIANIYDMMDDMYSSDDSKDSKENDDKKDEPKLSGTEITVDDISKNGPILIPNQVEYKIKSMYKERKCPNCGVAEKFDRMFEEGNIICRNCSIVVSTIIDGTLESRSYEDGKQKTSRCNVTINPLLPKTTASTSISGFGRLKRTHGWIVMSHAERTLRDDYNDIKKFCEKGKMEKSICEDALIFYKMIIGCKHVTGDNYDRPFIIRSTNRTSLKGACIYFACSKNGKSRRPLEIAEICNISYSAITKGIKLFQTLKMNKKLHAIQHNKYVILPEQKMISTEDFVNRFCDNTKIGSKLKDQAIKIAKNIKRLNIASDHNQVSLASGAILLMVELNGLSITKKVIANEFGVSEVTLSKIYRKIIKFTKALIDDKIAEKILEAMNEKKNKIGDDAKTREVKIEIHDTPPKKKTKKKNKMDKYLLKPIKSTLRQKIHEEYTKIHQDHLRMMKKSKMRRNKNK